MRTAAMLLPVLLLASVAHAYPREPDVTSSLRDVHEIVPDGPRVEEASVPEPDTDNVRERRSPRSWQQPGRPQPAPQPPKPQEPRGTISGGVHRERGVGTIVHAQGQGNVWTSRDGRSRVDAQGEWSKVVRGPARGKPNYNVGITYSRRF